MMMSDDDIADIQPDFIILDEFHRCGAEQWGKGVDKLLNEYDHVPILGFSATNIRYLDNQRDMADELFDGNITSEITLGEANLDVPYAYKTENSITLGKWTCTQRRNRDSLLDEPIERLEAIGMIWDRSGSVKVGIKEYSYNNMNETI